MKKATLLATLTVATAVLAGTAQQVSADETGVVTSPVDVVVSKPDEKPVTPVQPGTVDNEETTKPSVEPTSPVDPVVDKKEEEKPVEPTKLAEKEEEKPAEPAKDDKPSEKPAIPVDPKQPTAPNVTADELANKPVITDQGHKVVGTNNGNVLVEEAGVIVEKKAEEVGAVKQNDGTVALKNDKGELKVLPSTGTEQSLVGTILGSIALLGGAFLKKKVNA